MSRRRHEGFTLIELLVVVSVIALLISILLPSLKRARDQAKRVACASNLKQITQGVWNYWTEHNGRVPYVEDPMTNGELKPGFGNPKWTDDQINPFDRQKWPLSLPNVLMPTYVGTEERVFRCPAALVGWPRQRPPFRMTYRPAAANQPSGIVDNNSPYFREHFAFLDGRLFKPPPPYKYTGDVIADQMMSATERGAYVRDMVLRAKTKVIGPHDGGNNVVNKRLAVEYRNARRTNDDLLPFGTGVKF